MNKFIADISDAQNRDQQDSFQPLTHLFAMPIAKNGQPAIYLNGNSLGPMPKNTLQKVNAELEDWSHLGGRGHFEKENPWRSYVELVIPSLARLVGAKTKEVVATGTLTSNLHLTFVSFYQPTPQRYKIIRLSGFPSDTYAVASQVQQRIETISRFTGNIPFQSEEAIIEITPDKNGYISMDTFKETVEKHGKETALMWIEGVHFLTGQRFDIQELTQLAHKNGFKIGVDLAHAIGNVHLELHDWDVDFAVWCHYKYVCAGPGAIGGLYIHERYLSDNNLLRFSGWWGHNKETRFDMPSVFDPIPTAEGWQLSNSDILSLAALRGSLAIFDAVDLRTLQEKNKRLGAYLETLLLIQLESKISIITPKNPEERGCQFSLSLNTNMAVTDIAQALLEKGVVCDVRGKIIRVAPMGLYTRFVDVFHFVGILEEILSS